MLRSTGRGDGKRSGFSVVKNGVAAGEAVVGDAVEDGKQDVMAADGVRGMRNDHYGRRNFSRPLYTCVRMRYALQTGALGCDQGAHD